MEMDETLKQLMKQLGLAINSSLSESESISEAISNIKGAGYDVFLVLEATIGFNKREEKSRNGVLRSAISAGELRLTPEDAQFLRSLKIRLEGEKLLE